MRVRELAAPAALNQLLRYLLVGIASVALETGLFWLLFRGVGMSWVVANSAAIFCTFWFNFALNRWWSFRSRGPLQRQLVLYGSLFVFNLGMSNAIMYVLAEWGTLDFFAAKLLSIGMIVTWNFVLYRTVVYRQ